mgnify:CR=1 FL=1
MARSGPAKELLEIKYVVINEGKKFIVKVMCGIGTILNFKAKYVMIGTTSPLIQSGIIIIGFKATGRPNTMGSLILQKAGTIEAFPIALIRFDLDLNIIMASGRQLPIPPIAHQPL